jgi:hypothetical protein
MIWTTKLAPMQPQAVVEVMGGPAALHGPVRGLADLRAEIAKGFRLAALQNTVGHVYTDAADRKRLLYRVLPEGHTNAALRLAN